MDRTNSVAGSGVPVYASTGKLVGTFERDANGREWLVKRNLDPERHQLHKPPAWGTDAAHIERLRERGGYGVKLITIDGMVWTASLETFDRHGFIIDRGSGVQVVLPLPHWHKEDPKAARQMELFRVAS
jgi:hypothetical protein